MSTLQVTILAATALAPAATLGSALYDGDKANPPDGFDAIFAALFSVPLATPLQRATAAASLDKPSGKRNSFEIPPATNVSTRPMPHDRAGLPRGASAAPVALPTKIGVTEVDARVREASTLPDLPLATGMRTTPRAQALPSTRSEANLIPGAGNTALPVASSSEAKSYREELLLPKPSVVIAPAAPDSSSAATPFALVTATAPRTRMDTWSASLVPALDLSHVPQAAGDVQQPLAPISGGQQIGVSVLAQSPAFAAPFHPVQRFSISSAAMPQIAPRPAEPMFQVPSPIHNTGGQSDLRAVQRAVADAIAIGNLPQPSLTRISMAQPLPVLRAHTEAPAARATSEDTGTPAAEPPNDKAVQDPGNLVPLRVTFDNDHLARSESFDAGVGRQVLAAVKPQQISAMTDGTVPVAHQAPSAETAPISFTTLRPQPNPAAEALQPSPRVVAPGGLAVQATTTLGLTGAPGASSSQPETVRTNAQARGTDSQDVAQPPQTVSAAEQAPAPSPFARPQLPLPGGLPFASHQSSNAKMAGNDAYRAPDAKKDLAESISRPNESAAHDPVVNNSVAPPNAAAQTSSAAARPDAPVAATVHISFVSGTTAPAHATSAVPSADVQMRAPAAQPDITALAVHLTAKAKDGDHHFDIRLDPPDFGKIDVRLSVASDGHAQAHIAADKPQTLELLQRDQAVLHRALRDAGLDLSNNSLNFSLKGQERGDGGAPRYAARAPSLIATESAEATGPFPFAQSRAPAGRLDIRI